LAPLLIASPAALKEFVGREIAVTDWLVISQERIRAFAEATEDRQWIHLDEARAAKESPFKGTIAHGFLTLSLVAHFMQQSLKIESGLRLAVNYGLNRVRFPSPVRSGSRIRARVAVVSATDIGAEAMEVVFSVTVEGEGSAKPCCVAESIVRYYS
jgi:acyl dehydratase